MGIWCSSSLRIWLKKVRKFPHWKTYGFVIKRPNTHGIPKCTSGWWISYTWACYTMQQPSLVKGSFDRGRACRWKIWSTNHCALSVHTVERGRYWIYGYQLILLRLYYPVAIFCSFQMNIHYGIQRENQKITLDHVVQEGKNHSYSVLSLVILHCRNIF